MSAAPVDTQSMDRGSVLAVTGRLFVIYLFEATDEPAQTDRLWEGRA